MITRVRFCLHIHTNILLTTEQLLSLNGTHNHSKKLDAHPVNTSVLCFLRGLVALNWISLEQHVFGNVLFNLAQHSSLKLVYFRHLDKVLGSFADQEHVEQLC